MSKDPPAEDPSYDFKCYEIYISERRGLNDFQFQQSLSFDRTSITLSSGALALSLTFIKDVVGRNPPDFPCLLWAGWIALVVAILSTLISFQLSVTAYARQRQILDLEYNNPEQRGTHHNQVTRQVELANRVSLVAIILGVALLTIFVANNTWREKMPTRGAPPPASPAIPRPTPGAGSPPATNPAPPPPPKKG